MVDCSQFLDGYSDFRDGLLQGAVLKEYEEHLSVCSSCSRYDRVVGRGAQIFRELPPLDPSYDFLPRLQHRIYHLEEETRRSGRRASGTSVALTLAITVMLGMAAWAPTVRPRPAVVELPPVAAHAPHRAAPVPVLFRAGPLLAPVAQPVAVSAPPVSTLFFQYSPLGSSSATFVRPVSSH
jgi:hypothetical protein